MRQHTGDSILFSEEPMSTLPVVELAATPKSACMFLGTLEQPLSSLALVYGQKKQKTNKQRKKWKSPRVSLHPFFCMMFSLDFLASL